LKQENYYVTELKQTIVPKPGRSEHECSEVKRITGLHQLKCTEPFISK